jgi:hypothetical protein
MLRGGGHCPLRAEDLLRLWTAVRERLGAVWLHDASCRMYRPETFLDALREARGPATAESIFSAIREGRSWDLQPLLQEDRQLARAVDSLGRSPRRPARQHGPKAREQRGPLGAPRPAIAVTPSPRKSDGRGDRGGRTIRDEPLL